ncbi:MAG: HAMP domain-containing histidine kinase [Alphaproteobacteria bacterium]|nr:HAMP domain-containing histidine kinase [Alphaproteobacteria bacterium]MDE2110477.1 HAMP domain-containing histidine kinase [Alphaproteobacteria bacterium]
MRHNGRSHRERVSLLSGYSADMGQCFSRERSERALRAAAMEQALASRAKSEFLANMSHELRTPLNAIIGFSDLIGNHRNPGIDAEKISEYAGHINRAGVHLLAIISDILDISKIESGTFVLDIQQHALSELISASAALVEPRIAEKGQTLVLQLPAALPMVNVDGRRVKQVLINLLSNAHKFTPASGRITVRAAVSEGGALAVSVRDSGIGMTPEQIAVALRPFGQVNSSRSRTQEGTGLGLPIAKALIEKHGGKFSVASTENVGTTVTFTFPWSSAVLGDTTAEETP